MSIAITMVHVFACLVLVLVVLLQTGKGADMGAVFGGSSQTLFGSSGAGNFLTRLTTGAAVIFMMSSLALTYLASASLRSSVFDAAPGPPPIEAPAEPPPLAEPPAAEPPAADGQESAPEPGAAPAAGEAEPAPAAEAPAEAPAAENAPAEAAPAAEAPAPAAPEAQAPAADPAPAAGIVVEQPQAAAPAEPAAAPN